MINTDCDKQHLQNDLNILGKLSDNWQMLLIFWKCKFLHTGRGNMDGFLFIDGMGSTDVRFMASYCKALFFKLTFYCM